MTSLHPILSSIVIGFVLLVALVLAITVAFPPHIPGIVAPSGALPVVSHAFAVNRTNVQQIDAFSNVSLKKLISPVREQERGNVFPMTEDLSYVVIDRGTRTPPHILSGTTEAIYIVSGTTRVHANGTRVDAAAGQAVFIPKDTVQSIENTGDSPLVYISLLDPYYTEKAEIKINANATAEVSRDVVPLRLWTRGETDPGVYFDRLTLYQIISPTAGKNQGLNVSVSYSWGYVTIPSGGGSLPHSLKSTSEVIFVISGSATAKVEDGSFPIGEGDTLYIPPNAVQAVMNTGSGSLEYLSLLDPYWRPENDVNASKVVN